MTTSRGGTDWPEGSFEDEVLRGIKELRQQMSELQNGEIRTHHGLRIVNKKLDKLSKIELSLVLTGEATNVPLPSGAVSARIILGDDMAITVDTTNEVVSLEFDDDKNDVTTQPDGSSIAWATSDATLATVDADGNVAPLGVGTVSISASVNDSTGAPLDGFTQPDAVSLEIDPGAAVGARIKEAV